MTSEEIRNKALIILSKLEKLSPADRRNFVISKNFKWYECYSGALVNGVEIQKHEEPPKDFWLDAIIHFLNMQLVADYLAVIFKKYVPINYNSFYRSPFWNKYKNGSPNSEHKFARAGDTQPLHIILAMHKYALIIAKLCPDMNGFKVYRNFVHADMNKDFKIYK